MLDPPPLPANVAVLHVDLRRLRKARELLVGRLRRDDAGRLFIEVAQPHGKAAGIDRMELHEAGPGLVEEDVLAERADAREQLLRVVDGAVVGALLDDRGAERARTPPGFRILDQGIVADRFADGALVECGRLYRSDQAVGVAVGRQVDRNAAAEQQRAVVRRLVVVAVEQHEVVLRDQCREHDLVRRRGAVEDEIGLLRPEDRGCLFLRRQGRAFVGEQVTELDDRVVEIGAEHRLAHVLHEDAADRAAAVEDAAVMAGTGPQLVAFLPVVDERAEKRRLQRLGILLETADQALGDEGRRFLGEEDVAVDEVEHLDRHVLESFAPHQQHDRHFEPAPAHQVDQGRGLALEAFLSPIDHQAADGGVGLYSNFGILDPPRPHDLEAESLDRRDDLLDPQALEIVGIEGRGIEQKGESLVEVHGSDRSAGRRARSLLWVTLV